jgi:hypothetical protein
MFGRKRTLIGAISAALVVGATALGAYFAHVSLGPKPLVGAVLIGPTPLTGDLSCTGNNCLVESVSGTSPIVIGPATLQWDAGTASPTITQAAMAVAPTGAGDAGYSLTFQAQAGQAADGGTSNGGAGGPINLECASGGGSFGGTAGTTGFVNVVSPTGTVLWQLGALVGTPGQGAIYAGGVAPSSSNFALTANSTQTILNVPSGGTSFMQVAGVTGWASASGVVSTTSSISGRSTAVNWLATSVALTTSTGNVLPASQYQDPTLKFTGTLTGSGTTVTFPTTDGAFWNLDFSAVNFNTSNTIAIICNGVTWTGAANITATASTQFPRIRYTAGAARCVGTLDVE